MFINTAMGVVIDPTLYPGRLVICVDTNEDPNLGVFSGRHAGFRDTEMNKRQPVVVDPTWTGSGLECFEIIRNVTIPKDSVWQFHYAVIGLVRTSYTEYPVGQVLVLTGHSGELWDVAFAGVRIILHDYGQL